MSTVKFVPKPGKPHIRIIKDMWGGSDRYYLLPIIIDFPEENRPKALSYCLNANEGKYRTPGEAARALFNYRGEEK